MKTKAKYVIVILFLCTIPLYFCRMIGWKDDAIRLYDVILYGMESQEGDSFVGGMIWKLMQESVFENIKKDICSGNCIIHRDKRRSCVVNATTQLGMEKQG